jgi:hypothetical protein
MSKVCVGLWTVARRAETLLRSIYGHCPAFSWLSFVVVASRCLCLVSSWLVLYNACFVWLRYA